MGLFNKIKNFFSKEESCELPESIEKINESINSANIDEYKKIELSGSLKFPKKVGKANMLVEKPLVNEEKDSKPKKVGRKTLPNADYFKKKATGGKRNCNTNKNSGKRNYNRNKKG